MTFNIDFDERAFKEWNKLDKTILTSLKRNSGNYSIIPTLVLPGFMVTWRDVLK